MKIGILTHYTVVNQGTVLQMLALKEWLEDHGDEVFFLTYTKDYDFDAVEEKRYSLSVKNAPFYFKEYVIKKGLFLTWFMVRKHLLYRKYNSKTFNYANYAINKMDAVIVGSDEVFSVAYGCNKMMYGHGVNTDTLISYAPSFGQTDIKRIDEFHCRELIASGLSKFKALSVRDVNSAQIVEELTGVKPQLVCDPVILYDFSNTHTKIKPIKKPYLLLYSYDRWMIEESEIKAIKSYAKSKNLLVASIGTYHKWCDINIVCNPIEWLEYYRGATEVITDTFHGSVLSVITNRQTAYYTRNLNSNKMTSLLASLGLSDRILTSVEEDKIREIQSKPTDFEKVNKALGELRKSSNEFLENALYK